MKVVKSVAVTLCLSRGEFPLCTTNLFRLLKMARRTPSPQVGGGRWSTGLRFFIGHGRSPSFLVGYVGIYRPRRPPPALVGYVGIGRAGRRPPTRCMYVSIRAPRVAPRATGMWVCGYIYGPPGGRLRKNRVHAIDRTTAEAGSP